MKVMNIQNAPYYGANFSSANTKTNNSQAVKSMSNNNASNVLCDKNYGVLQVNKPSVAFTGKVPPVKDLSHKVNNLFNIVKSNDLIIASKDLKTGINDLKENVENIKNVIKRVFFVEEKQLDRTIAFRKNLGEREAINLSEKPLIIKDSKNEAGFLSKGEAGYLIDGDTVNSGSFPIKIQEDPNTSLPIKDLFNYFVDLDKEVEPKIQQINENSLSKLVADKTEKVKDKKIMFSDVGGMDSTIEELRETIIYPMKYPELTNGRNIDKSVLLYGPPGTGKSLVAEACANESGAWFKKINASQLDSKWVGESEENWTNLFNEAREKQPSIIFIDEIDAIGKKRGGTDVYGDKTLNTILGVMSESEKRGDDIYVIAATNKRGMLDDALTRSGRIGKAIEVPKPDLKGTGDILDIYAAKEPLDKNFDKKSVAKKLHENGATGADIAIITEKARKEALKREHIYEKIKNGTYKREDAENLTIKNEDFDNAIKSFSESNKDKSRRPIGFNSSLYQ